MPSCTDGHAHYLMPLTLGNMKGGVLFKHEDAKAEVLRKIDAAARAAKTLPQNYRDGRFPDFRNAK